jgi:hypothetical protein
MFLHMTLLYTYSTLKNAVRAAIGPIATPDFIIYGDLPKVHMLLAVLCVRELAFRSGNALAVYPCCVVPI